MLSEARRAKIFGKLRVAVRQRATETSSVGIRMGFCVGGACGSCQAASHRDELGGDYDGILQLIGVFSC